MVLKIQYSKSHRKLYCLIVCFVWLSKTKSSYNLLTRVFCFTNFCMHLMFCFLFIMFCIEFWRLLVLINELYLDHKVITQCIDTLMHISLFTLFTFFSVIFLFMLFWYQKFWLSLSKCWCFINVLQRITRLLFFLGWNNRNG